MLQFLKALVCNGESYAIKVLHKCGVTTFLPVYRPKGFGTKYQPIVKVYDRYLTLDIEKDNGLSEEECVAHLEAYKEQIAREKIENAVSVEYRAHTFL